MNYQSLLNSIENSSSNTDDDIIEALLEEMRNYDKIDLLSKLSILRLIPENQKFALRLDFLFFKISLIPESDWISSNKISQGKLKLFTQKLSNLFLCSQEDIPEAPFLDRILFYDNYYVFNGNYAGGAYYLQALINTLRVNSHKFDVNFIKQINCLTYACLKISNDLCKSLNYNFDTLYECTFDEMNVPTQNIFKENLKFVKFEKEEFLSLLNYDLELYDYLVLQQPNHNCYTSYPQILTKPFIENDNLIVLTDATILPSLIVHIAVCLYSQHFNNSILIDEFNATVWKDVLKNFHTLGHKKILEKDLDIQLIDSPCYKNVILTAFNNKLFIVHALFDDGCGYDEKSMFSDFSIQSSKNSDILSSQIRSIIKSLSNQGIGQDSIFQCFVSVSFNRTGTFATKTPLDNSLNTLRLNPYELKYIAINEKKNLMFLPRYIIEKNKINFSPTLYSELNLIEIYTQHENSFYLGDSINYRDFNLMYISPDYISTYIIKAMKKVDLKLVNSFRGDYLSEIALEDVIRKIYRPLNTFKNKPAKYIAFENSPIWLVGQDPKDYEELNVTMSILDVSSFWLAELKEWFKLQNFDTQINIYFELTEKGNEYYCTKKHSKKFSECVDSIVDANAIKILITPELYVLFATTTNSYEREFALYLLKCICQYFEVDYSFDEKFEKTFIPTHKMQMNSYNLETNPYAAPMDRLHAENLLINSSDVNSDLSRIGNNLVEKRGWNFGVVPNEKVNALLQSVVSDLYNEVVAIVSNLSSKNLYETIYFDAERTISNLDLYNRRFKIDIACYPEKHNEVIKAISELNRTSLAIKFLIEYVAATEPSGENLLDQFTYEKLLAKCSLIIDWAYQKDLFYYKIDSTKVEILKSNRIGIEKSRQGAINQIITNANYHIKQDEEKTSIQKFSLIDFLPEDLFFDELNKAFLCEFGYKFSDFCMIIISLLELGLTITSEVKIYSKEHVIDIIKSDNEKLSDEIIKKILKDLTLQKRKEFLSPLPPFRKEDVYPWRFNRKLSLTRRPLIERSGELIWGTRIVYHSLLYVQQLITDGILQVDSKEFKAFLGKINNHNGKVFNENVFSIIQNFENCIVFKNIKKIEGLKITDEKNNDLGDIDILCISKKNKTIYVIESKNFRISRNPYEIYCEYQSIFEDKKDKKCFISKHSRRVNWVQSNIEYIKSFYQLKDVKWVVKGVFVTNDEMISNQLYNKNMNFLSYKSLSLENLLNL